MRTTHDRVDTVVFDVDGTLVDTNYLHTLAWDRAFAELDVPVPMWRIHRAIGMGGDRLIAHVADEATEEKLGDALREAWQRHYDPLLPEVRPFADADVLLRDLAERGLQVVLASSGKPEHLERALEVLGADDVISAVTSASDADSKPEPDLIEQAVESVSGENAIMVGDSVWDALAALRSGHPMVGVLSGGFGREELERAGARVVVRDPTEMLLRIDEFLEALAP